MHKNILNNMERRAVSPLQLSRAACLSWRPSWYQIKLKLGIYELGLSNLETVSCLIYH